MIQFMSHFNDSFTRHDRKWADIIYIGGINLGLSGDLMMKKEMWVLRLHRLRITVLDTELLLMQPTYFLDYLMTIIK